MVSKVPRILAGIACVNLQELLFFYSKVALKEKKKPPLFPCRNNPLEELQRLFYSCIEVVCCNIKKVATERWRKFSARC